MIFSISRLLLVEKKGQHSDAAPHCPMNKTETYVLQSNTTGAICQVSCSILAYFKRKEDFIFLYIQIISFIKTAITKQLPIMAYSKITHDEIKNIQSKKKFVISVLRFLGERQCALSPKRRGVVI